MEPQSDDRRNVGDLEFEGYLTSEATTEGPWRIRTHWFYAEGGAVPAAMDIEFTSVPETFRSELKHTEFAPGSPSPAALSRTAIESLPLGRILREHRGMAWASMRAEADQGVKGGAFHRWASEQADAVADPPAQSRPSPADKHFRRVAELHQQAPGPHRSLWVAEQLWAEGYTFERKGEQVSPTHDRVRQWIGAARERGYMPPTERKQGR